MSASNHSSDPTTAASALSQSCAVIEKVLGLSTTHRESDRGIFIDNGLYVIKQGSSYVMISVVHSGEHRDQVLVRVTAQVVAGVKPDGTLFKRLLVLNGKLRFGAFAFEPEGNLVLFSHTLLGGASLNPNEVMAAVHDVALAADRYDDAIVTHWGGRRMQDVIEESAWARLLHKVSGDAHPHLDEDAAPKTPPSGGSKKGN
jgi:hypothetical protein